VAQASKLFLNPNNKETAFAALDLIEYEEEARALREEVSILRNLVLAERKRFRERLARLEEDCRKWKTRYLDVRKLAEARSGGANLQAELSNIVGLFAPDPRPAPAVDRFRPHSAAADYRCLEEDAASHGSRSQSPPPRRMLSSSFDSPILERARPSSHHPYNGDDVRSESPDPRPHPHAMPPPAGHFRRRGSISASSRPVSPERGLPGSGSGDGAGDPLSPGRSGSFRVAVAAAAAAAAAASRGSERRLLPGADSAAAAGRRSPSPTRRCCLHTYTRARAHTHTHIDR
jgi:hypothetical protein